MKRIVSILLAVAVILSLGMYAFAAGGSVAGFNDVSDDAWYAEAVAWCKENGILSGTSSTTFAPDGTLTRAMLAASLHRTAGTPAVSGTTGFSDTQAGAWYSNAVVWANDSGLIQGYGNGLFGTDDPVTREQLAAILWRYAGTNNTGTAQITDQSTVSGYAVTAVNWAVDAGIMLPRNDGSFAPKQNANRAEVAYALYIYLSSQNGSTSAPVAYAPIPDAYRQEAGQKGTLQRVNYRSNGGEKHAYVYVPYGYNEAVKYDVFYVMHGGGGSAETYMGSDTNPDNFKNVIDNMVMNKDIAPMLLVFPSFYPSGAGDNSVANAGALTEKFHEELVNDLLPAVESRYHTYAETTDDAGLKASRSHRAFGGFSMGSVTTWYTFINCLDYFSTFMPTSGDCWVLGMQASGTDAKPTAEYLANVVRESGYGKNDFRILAATGTEDIAYTMLNNQIEAMKTETDVFTFSENIGTGNLHYILAAGQAHTRDAACDYLYDTLRLLYPNTDSDETPAPTQKKPLVAYFAYSENMGDTSGMEVDAISSASLNASTSNTDGNLQVMAQVIAEQTDADMFHILVSNPYDHNYSTMLPRAIEELDSGNYPALQNSVNDLANHDVIYLGTPVWAGGLPPAMRTFLKENDLSGKKIVLFGIHLGSGLGSMERELRKLAPNAELVDSFTISASTGNAAVREQFSQWLADLKL